jgi:hypothetical protein
MGAIPVPMGKIGNWLAGKRLERAKLWEARKWNWVRK